MVTVAGVPRHFPGCFAADCQTGGATSDQRQAAVDLSDHDRLALGDGKQAQPSPRLQTLLRPEPPVSRTPSGLGLLGLLWPIFALAGRSPHLLFFALSYYWFVHAATYTPSASLQGDDPLLPRSGLVQAQLCKGRSYAKVFEQNPATTGDRKG